MEKTQAARHSDAVSNNAATVQCGFLMLYIFRVLNTFKSIVEALESQDMYILDRMREFVTKDEVKQFAAAKQLLTLIERAVCFAHLLSSIKLIFIFQQSGGEIKVKTVTASLTSPPAPMQPKTSKKLKLLDIHPLELARQLTIMESTLYQSITPMECLQRARETKSEYQDNIHNVTQNFNQVRFTI